MPLKLINGAQAAAYGAKAAGAVYIGGKCPSGIPDILQTEPEEAIMHPVSGRGGAIVFVNENYFTSFSKLLNVVSGRLKGGLAIAVTGSSITCGEDMVARFARSVNLPLLCPSSAEEAFDMAFDAVSLSCGIASPVFIRLENDICESFATVDPETSRIASVAGDIMRRYNKVFTPPRQNVPDSQALAVSGYLTGYVYEALEALYITLPVLSVKMLLPFPDSLAVDFLSRSREVLVFDNEQSGFYNVLAGLIKKKGLKTRLFCSGIDRDLLKKKDLTYHATRVISDFLGIHPPAEPFLPDYPVNADRSGNAKKGEGA